MRLNSNASQWISIFFLFLLVSWSWCCRCLLMPCGHDSVCVAMMFNDRICMRIVKNSAPKEMLFYFPAKNGALVGECCVVTTKSMLKCTNISASRTNDGKYIVFISYFAFNDEKNGKIPNNFINNCNHDEPNVRCAWEKFTESNRRVLIRECLDMW